MRSVILVSLLAACVPSPTRPQVSGGVGAAPVAGDGGAAHDPNDGGAHASSDAGMPSGGDGGTRTSADDMALAGDAAVLRSPDLSAPAGTIVFDEPFALPDGSAWPAPWRVAGGVASADVRGGRGRLAPTPSAYSLARMAHPATARDVDATYLVSFADLSTSGAGFYVRQDGGYLTATTPRGQGYCAFVEGFRGFTGIGLWRELGGSESEIDHVVVPLSSGVPYRVRFTVRQLDPATTQLQAKIWPDGAAEPAAWSITRDDTTPALQGISGGVAVDSWSSLTSGTIATPADVFFGDIVVRAL